MSRAVRIDEPGRLGVVPIEMPKLAAGEALIQIGWAGICGSDSELLEGSRPAPYVRYPIVPGHEWSGTVFAVADGVDPSLVGRPVVGEGFRSCQRCAACRRGEPTVCAAEYEETGFTQPGGWSDWLALPARLLHVLPDGADLRAAALLEPAACVAEACLRAALLPGERAAVVGAGTLGLLATQLLYAGSPASLVVVHRRASRTELALRCGATALVTLDNLDAIAGSFDVVIEAAGTGPAAATAVQLARRGGRVVLTGIPGESDTDDGVSSRELVTRNVTVHTVFGAPPRAWVHAVNAFAAGLLDPAVLVTHEFVLEDAAEAFRVLADRSLGAGKILLHP